MSAPQTTRSIFAMQISPVTGSDLPQLAALYEQLGASQFCIENMRAALAKNKSASNPTVFVAKIDGELIGTLLAATCQMLFGECKSFLVVEDIVVDAAYRRRGVGRALMQYAEAFAARHNCSYIMLITDSCRTDAQAFYHSLGYKSAEYCAFKKRL